MKPISSGKVRELYEVSDDKLVIVTTDRISAYDVILPVTVNGKGIVLNKMSNFWFKRTKNIIKNHVITDDTSEMPEFFHDEKFRNRTVMVKKLNILPFEFIVRGYIFGTMWRAYEANEPYCGKIIEGKYEQAQKLEAPIITPSTKAEGGEHDEYVDLEFVKSKIGAELTDKIVGVSLRLYKECGEYAAERGIIIADTKFEFGLNADGELVLADEIFTPDSSRFWNAAEYKIGTSPKSYDKQLLRDWLLENKKDGEFQFDAVPASVIEETGRIYRECLEKLLEER
ncbi:phosphoribosylaminoimidazole-succinocarboxamide synthase [Clostridia bacterium]|nr:phosphoribosylaminoimidazole-succinocarboxamide synthase [Clostridia bacterium]